MENKINILMSGLPGKMATAVAEKIRAQEDMNLCAKALTGNIPENSTLIKLLLSDNTYGPKETMMIVDLVKPDNHKHFLNEITLSGKYNNPIVVDYSQPDAVTKNAEFYCRYNIPFVMGTTGGDRKALEETVRLSASSSAVIAPNMAKQIVALQSFMDEYSTKNPNSLKGCKLDIIESHQQGKKDTSGTAKAMVTYFNKLGIDFKPEQIRMMRDVKAQLNIGVPENYLSGHGWHSYFIELKNSEGGILDLCGGLISFLKDDKSFSDYKDVPFRYRDIFFGFPHLLKISKEGTTSFLTKLSYDGIEIQHNVNGRDIYAEGTIDAIRFLNKKFYQENQKGKVYSMIDVLKEGN